MTGRTLPKTLAFAWQNPASKITGAERGEGRRRSRRLFGQGLAGKGQGFGQGFDGAIIMISGIWQGWQGFLYSIAPFGEKRARRLEKYKV
jgi:hypothetical protein